VDLEVLMALHVTEEDVQAWLEPTKMTVNTIDIELEQQIAAEIMGVLASVHPEQVPSWTTAINTPIIVKKIIAMQLAGWMYLRQYSETDDGNPYAYRLINKAEDLLQGIISGAVDIVEVPGVPTAGQPVFFPTDASSASLPTRDNPSDGPPRFSMAQVF
jgi:hypothetical protein